ncbi:MAG TPA: sulfur carrier protein ThiS [Sporosarcina psychrophila]|uniref:Sulfur carrier protein ThiS n=1 Tax=Sporosarcina psychrophila TaxID=1476 RepID=A0A921KCI7_SPOPS|nr:sulfur carrier protein ThiS [Sporosarcina psychrophila]
MKRTIELNGSPYEMPAEVESVQGLLRHLELEERIVIIEMNRDILAKDGYDKPINDRDQIEIIHFVGGG